MKRVLIAEDEATIREFVVINLKRGGYDVVEAEDGAQALELYDCLTRRQLAAGVTDTAQIARYVLNCVGAEEPPYLFMTMYTIDEHIKEIKAESTEEK